jgi:hypothetical protein
MSYFNGKELLGYWSLNNSNMSVSDDLAFGNLQSLGQCFLGFSLQFLNVCLLMPSSLFCMCEGGSWPFNYREFCWLYYNWLKYTHWTAKVLRWDINSDFWDINCMKVFIGPTVYMTAILVSKAILYNIDGMIVCMFIAVLLEILQFVPWVRNGSCSEEVYLDVVNKPVTNIVISVTTSVIFFLSWSHFLLF